VSEVLCVGELMWDVHVQGGASLETGADLRRVPGGASANTAMTLVQLGAMAAVTGHVGNDPVGRGLCQVLSEEHGVDCSAVAFVPGRTGLVFLERSDVEHERFVSYRPRLLWQSLAQPEAWSGKVLHISALNPVEEQLDDYLALSTSRTGWLMVDVNARPRAYRRSKLPLPSLEALLARVDVLKLSDGDRRVLERLNLSFEALLAMLSPSAICLHTHAAEPTELYCAGQLVCSVPTHEVELQRSIGAGDAFCAGVLYYLATNERSQAPAFGDDGWQAFWQEAIALGHEVAARRISSAQ
jgi:fructokinase